MRTLSTLAPWLALSAVAATLTWWAAEGRPAEPATFWTDYLLASQATVFSVLLYRLARLTASPLGFGWAGAFAAVALGAALGGSSHALAPYLPTEGMWRATLWALGAASFFLCAVTLLPRLPPRWRKVVWTLLVLELFVYAAWVMRDADFLVAMRQYGAALVLILAVEAVSWARRRTAGATWLVAAVVVSAAAAVLQRSELAIGALNHNDLYHVVQFGGTWLMYEGARRRVVAVARGGGAV